ncbi:MAG TPA: oxidoreductase [Bacteroidia bacterium]|jgi:uncharacterized protein YbjT (DUF2867 family)
MRRTAIVLGATGLVGNEVLKLLLQDDSFDQVKIFVRRSLQFSHPKLREHVINFNVINDHQEDIKGDVLFCCIGTTIKTAGSKEAFAQVDEHIPLAFARIAKQNGLKQFLIISSLGADKNSSNFYLKVKGEVEAVLETINFESLIILRPSMLLGERKEFRLGESIGKFLMKTLSFVFIRKLKKYKAIEAKAVASAMVRLSKTATANAKIIESDEIQSIGS